MISPKFIMEGLINWNQSEALFRTRVALSYPFFSPESNDNVNERSRGCRRSQILSQHLFSRSSPLLQFPRTNSRRPKPKFSNPSQPKIYLLIDMPIGIEHEDIVQYISKCFSAPNGLEDNFCPLKVTGAPSIIPNSIYSWFSNIPMIFHHAYLLLAHRSPRADGRIAPDACIRPANAYVQPPNTPYPGPPPDNLGRPYPRVICEIAVSQDTSDWERKCKTWLLQPYVRYVIGIKIHKLRRSKNEAGKNYRSMTVRISWSSFIFFMPKIS